jgi:AbiV family abortive infection protein
VDLSFPAIEGACAKVLKNASDLLVEAELLYSAQHYPRAYTLAHLALEEFTKLSTLIDAATRADLGLPVDAKELQRRLTNHEEKIATSSTFSRSVELLPNASSLYDLIVPRTERPQVHRLNELKNRSLYCGVHGSAFEMPSDVVSEAMAAAAIAEASKVLECFGKGDLSAAGWATRLKDPVLRASMVFLFRIGWRHRTRPVKGVEAGRNDGQPRARVPAPVGYWERMPACLFVERSLEVLAPFISTEQTLKLRAAYFAIDNDRDFVTFVGFLMELAREGNVTLPSPEKEE